MIGIDRGIKMNIPCKVYDTKDDSLYIAVGNNYFTVKDAKNTYRKSLSTNEKDVSILIEIAEDGAKEVEASLCLGVEEGEKFALSLLNICSQIKS